MTLSTNQNFYQQVQNIHQGNDTFTFFEDETHKYYEELAFLQSIIVQYAKTGATCFTLWSVSIFFNDLSYSKTKVKMKTLAHFFKKLGFDTEVVPDDENKRVYMDIRWTLH